MHSNSRPSVSFVVLRHRHDSARSGYGLLPEYIDGTVVETRRGRSLLALRARKTLRPVARASGNPWFHDAQMVTELATAWRWKRVSGAVFHALYGENSYPRRAPCVLCVSIGRRPGRLCDLGCGELGIDARDSAIMTDSASGT